RHLQQVVAYRRPELPDEHDVAVGRHGHDRDRVVLVDHLVLADARPGLDLDAQVVAGPGEAGGRGLGHAAQLGTAAVRSAVRLARCSADAPTNARNNGCGRVGRDRSSGWNCPAMKNGWSGSSMISASRPFCEEPLITMPPACRAS